MSDKEILDNYINIHKSYLTDTGKIQAVEMLYKYKDASILKEEIGTFPNIELGINGTEKAPFFIRSYHVKEEDTNF